MRAGGPVRRWGGQLLDDAEEPYLPPGAEGRAARPKRRSNGASPALDRQVLTAAPVGPGIFPGSILSLIHASALALIRASALASA